MDAETNESPNGFPANRETFCFYHEGMFALEAVPFANELDALRYHLNERSGLLYHEAAHAVFRYALGLGASDIDITTTVFDDEGKSATGGMTRPRMQKKVKFDRGYNPRLLALGVSTAAGPAAERKYYLGTGAPIRVRGGSIGDHNFIEEIGKGLERCADRNSQAYQRLVWHVAQIALENPLVWRAIECLAKTLSEYCPEPDWEPGEYEETMSAGRVRLVIRRAGVKVGVLGFTVRGRCTDRAASD